MTTNDRQRQCGAHSIRALGSVDVRKKGDVVGISGLASCGRWYTCPYCAAQIAARRRREIEQAVAQAVAQGLVVAMVTLTVRHNRRHALRLLLDALSEGWRKGVGQDQAVRRLRRELGWVGYIRALEVTFGGSGWHPHHHLIVFFDPEAATVPWVNGELDSDRLDALGKATLRAWTARLLKVGLRAPNRHGYDLRVLANPADEVAAYLTKSTLGRELGPESIRRVASAAYELTGAMTKQGKALPSGKVLSRTHWDIVAGAAEGSAAIAAVKRTLPTWSSISDLYREALHAKRADLDRDVGIDKETGEVTTLGMVRAAVSQDVALYWELEEAMPGRSMTLWSPGLKERFGVGELTDDDIVSEALSGPESTVIGLPMSGVRSTQSKGLWHGLKGAVRRGERDGGVAFCDANEIEWLEADDPTLVVDRTYRDWHGQKGYHAALDARDEIAYRRWLASQGGGGPGAPQTDP